MESRDAGSLPSQELQAGVGASRETARRGVASKNRVVVRVTGIGYWTWSDLWRANATHWFYALEAETSEGRGFLQGTG